MRTRSIPRPRRASRAQALLGYYGVAFHCLSKALRTIPMGIAYAIWLGIGIVVISLIGFVLYRQKLDGPALLGMGLIVTGTLVINLFSGSKAA